MSQLDQVKVVLGNRVTALSHLSTDIDDVAHEVKRKSEQSEQYYRDVLGAMPVAIYLTDSAGKIIYYNEAAVELAGHRPTVGSDEWCVSWRLFWPDGTPMPHNACPMAVALRERRPIRGQEIIAERPDGSRILVLPFPTPLFDESGSLIGAVNMLLDISDRKGKAVDAGRLTKLLEKQVEERTQALVATIAQLRESERTCRLLVEGVTDYSIFMLDTQGRVTNWNAGAQRIKGYMRSEIVGEHFSRFYTEEARRSGLPELALTTAARTGRFEAEDWRVRKDGSRFWANVVIDAIHDEEGQLIGFAKITRDLTERRAIEDKLRQVQRMEAVGQLTAGIAHDFNNLLTVILGNLELIERQQVESDGEKRSARMARSIGLAIEGGKRAAALTRRLLAFSRQQALEPEQIDVSQFIYHVRELLERTLGESIRIRTILALGPSFVFADAAELENALLNLAVNARDAMPNGGTLTIEASKVAEPPATNGDRDAAGGPQVLITVSDTGAGMTQEVLTRAFEPFFTTKGADRGTGLGLSQVYGFVTQSGGKVIIDSQPGLGTAVKLYLPRFVPDPAVSLNPASKKESRGADRGSATILVVEDDDAVRDFSTEVLRNLGYTVLEATNADAALKTLEYRSDVQLLFTDIGLPGTINGWQLSSEVRQRHPRLRVLVTTAYLRGTPHGMTRLDRGVSIIAKPFSVTDLAKKVNEAMIN